MVPMVIRCNFRSKLFSFRPADFLNEFAKPLMILPAGAGFHSTGNVNPVRAHDANGRGHVFNLQASCQNNTVAQRRAASDIPIRGAARTTILARMGGVKQKSKSAGVFVESRKRKFGFDAKRLDDGSRRSAVGNEIGRFVAVKLD